MKANPPKADAAFIRQLQRRVEVDGLPASATALGVSQPTLVRLMAGLPVRAGSLALARMRADALSKV